VVFKKWPLISAPVREFCTEFAAVNCVAAAERFTPNWEPVTVAAAFSDRMSQVYR